MAFQKLRFERDGRVVLITLDRADAQNAIDRALNADLHAAWAEFAADDGLDVAVLTGTGRAFCAGADLADYIPQFLDGDMLKVRANVPTGLGGITRGQHRLAKPVVAAVNGWALAGGFELALACDVRIAAEGAKFGSYEIHRGFHHGDGGIVRMVQSIGVARTMDIVLTGREVSAAEALSIGLVSRVVPADALLPTALDYAGRIAAKSQVAVRSAKETILEVTGRTLDDALRLEALYGYSSGDVREVKRQLDSFFAKNSGSGA
ncbi:enoyl-CoA hydratase/isomerase family protein [Niveispirillum sp. KHB5.9]|uniref:enoyl-CoA hydratase/isomerase family protein n=1 Tax=Niveispirillum sp. KHB5.9 TaxID=3400269 RepID=UPI003A878207